jgi:hypothetical protein
VDATNWYTVTPASTGQPLDASLTDIAAITQVDGDIIMSDGSDYKAVPRQHRRLNINGEMRVVQRGTSETAVWSGGGAMIQVADRYKHERGSGSEVGEATVTQSTDVPAGKGFAYSLKFDVTTADTSIASADYYAMLHHIEAQDLQHLEYGTSAAKAMVLSFWFKASLAQTFCVSLDQDDASRRIGIPFTISSADTWEFFALAIPGDTGGTINNDTGSGLRLRWMFSAGSNYQGGGANSWASSNSNALGIDMGSTNEFATTDEDWYITGIQLEIGSIDTPFEHLTYGDELSACYRYYQQHNWQEASSQKIGTVNFYASTAGMIELQFPTMRAAPTVTWSADGTFVLVDGANGAATITSQAAQGTGKFSLVHQFGCSGATTGGGYIQRDGTDAAYVTLSAEL